MKRKDIGDFFRPSRKKRKFNKDELKQYKEERRKTLNLKWSDICTTLKKLEEFIVSQNTQNKKKPWNIDEHSKVFTIIYDLCTLPDCNFFEKKLYQKYSEYLKDYLTNRILLELKNSPSQKLLPKIVQLWKSYKNIFVKYCSHILGYLDRFFVKTDSQLSLTFKGIELYRDTVFEQLKEKLKKIILSNIDDDRKGEPRAARSELRESLLMFMDMSLNDEDYKEYEKLIEKNAAENTVLYYRNLSQNWINKLTTSEYLERAEKRIIEETKRLSSIFVPNSRKKISQKVDEELIYKRQERLLKNPGSGVVDMIKEKRFEELKRLCRLMGRVKDGLGPVADIFTKYIVDVGMGIFGMYQDTIMNKDYQSSIKVLLGSYVDKLLEIYEYFSAIVSGPFSQSVIFSKALHNGFKVFCNRNFNRNGSGFEISCALIFAYYCDEMIRKREITSEIDDKIDKIICFLQFFNDKDIFMEEYRRQLCKRLLVTGYQEEIEKNMIQKFKLSKSGISDVYKLEKMLTDKITGLEMNSKFKNRNVSQSDNSQSDNSLVVVSQKMPFEFNIQLLTMNIWPLSFNETLITPSVFKKGEKIFETFYSQIHSHRVLKWAYNNSTVQLNGNFIKGRKVFDVTTYQTAVLLLFNDNVICSISEICDATGLQGNLLMKIIVSLSNKKYRILKCPVGKFKKKWYKDGGQKLCVNEGFRSKFMRLKITLPRVTESESKSTKKKVENDRIVTIDAAIVRIMKIRKRMNIKNLVNETINQLASRFLPEVKLIKKRIENLMEREYLVRSGQRFVDYVA